MRMSLITSVLTISLVVPRDIFHELAHERENMFEMDAVECESNSCYSVFETHENLVKSKNLLH